MEEIDIIELLQRVKEGKAPKKIEIRGVRFVYDDDTDILAYMYENDECNWYSLQMTLDTKIKILDKPILEELPEDEIIDIFDLADKINEIIRYLRSKDER